MPWYVLVAAAGLIQLIRADIVLANLALPPALRLLLYHLRLAALLLEYP